MSVLRCSFCFGVLNIVLLLVKFSQFEKLEEINTVEAEPQPIILDLETSTAPTEVIGGSEIDVQGQRMCSDTTGIMKIVPDIDVSHHFIRMEKCYHFSTSRNVIFT